MTNIHSQSIPQNILDEVKQKISESIALLNPFIVSLTPEERSDCFKLGDKTLAFVEKVKNTFR